MIDFFTNTANSTNSFFTNTFTSQPLITTTISNNIPAYAPTRIYNDYQIITPDIVDRGMFNDFQTSAPLQAQYEPIQTLNTQVFQPIDVSRPKTLAKLNIPQISTPQIIPAYVYEPITVNPPTVNKNIKPMAQSIGVFKVIDPPHIVAIHENTFMPVGTAIIMVASFNLRVASSAVA